MKIVCVDDERLVLYLIVSMCRDLPQKPEVSGFSRSAEAGMKTKPLPKEENIYDAERPILYAMKLIGQKWKLPILWYIADAKNQTLRYRELERKVVGITAAMLTKCLRELEKDRFITRTQYNTIPPTVEYSLAEKGKTLIPALESVYQWAEEQMEE